MLKLPVQSRLWRRPLGLATVMIFLLVATVSAAPMAISIGGVTSSWSGALPSGSGATYSVPGGPGVESTVSWGTSTGFGQSSYGFTGNSASANIDPGQYYLLGRFTHNNRPIQGGTITSVQLNLQLPVCGTTQTYNYTFAHDETSNDGTAKPPCKYGPGDPGWPTSGNPNANSCADRVTLPTTPPATTVTCSGTTYTLFLTGFYPTSGACPSAPPTGVTISQYFYTSEQASNPACVYGRLGSPLAVTLAGFSADAVSNGVQVTWETVSELRNLGFNLYRSTAPDGILTQLNDRLIPSQAPDSPMGFSYAWTDTANLAPGATYYYWIEDVDLDGGTKRQDPVSVTYSGPTAVRLADFGAASAFPAALPVAGLGLAVMAALAAGLRRRR